jgi:hypothetical protein
MTRFLDHLPGQIGDEMSNPLQRAEARVDVVFEQQQQAVFDVLDDYYERLKPLGINSEAMEVLCDVTADMADALEVAMSARAVKGQPS